MARKKTIEIKEEADFLLEELSKSKVKLKCDRIKTLIYIKEKPFYFQRDIVKDLERSEKTIRGWIQEYSKNGYEGLLKVKSIGNNTRKISDKAVKHISKFLKKEKISILIKFESEVKGYSSNEDESYEGVISYNFELSSFAKLKSQCEEKLGEKISYDAFYSHLKRNHTKEFNFLRDHFTKKRKKKISQRSKKQIKEELPE
ncbi:MAG TPA: hypothetical protein VFS71_10340 [Flavobacterium sp.]|uniref:hypothetical protein n=1 Tax=Flavobacterium sp. TaxID=239 RepID=UPI002DB5A06A|nr:hypothetical protein [Flavobacterium sp.]HEU4790075.1 hypothetical protein [Flavobacterium sp.]